MEQEIAEVMPENAASSYNQGLIEIGALVCIPGGEQNAVNVLWHLCALQRKGDFGKKYL